jgi:hypothetical protein
MFTKKIGKFKLDSDVVRLSDPCYDKDTWCAGTVEDVIPGEWTSKIIKYTHEETDWGERVGELIAQHNDYDIRGCEWEKVDIHVGVDSGQAGIFDDSQFKNDMSKEHNLTCDKKDKEEDKWRLEHDISMDSSSLLEYLMKENKTKDDEGMIEFYQRHIANNRKKLENFDEHWENLRARTKKLYPEHFDKKSKEFYEVCCAKTLSYIGAGTVEYGVVASSGYGDGGYNAYVIRNTKNKVVAIKIVFISMNEEEYENV